MVPSRDRIASESFHVAPADKYERLEETVPEFFGHHGRLVEPAGRSLEVTGPQRGFAQLLERPGEVVGERAVATDTGCFGEHRHGMLEIARQPQPDAEVEPYRRPPPVIAQGVEPGGRTPPDRQ